MRNDTQIDLVLETLNLSFFLYTQRECMSDVMDKIQDIFHELCLC